MSTVAVSMDGELQAESTTPAAASVWNSVCGVLLELGQGFCLELGHDVCLELSRGVCLELGNHSVCLELGLWRLSGTRSGFSAASPKATAASRLWELGGLVPTRHQSSRR